MDASPLRMGILGAARIAPMALVRPARAVAEAEVVAVAARDGARARIFARKHGIARVHESYAALIANPEIAICQNGEMLITGRALLITPRNNAPSSALPTVPIPPAMDTPPITQAAMMVSSYPLATCTDPITNRDTHR